MRLIDADVLYIPSEEMNARMAVAYAPTVDAVPVVRCKDCKHRPIKPEKYRGVFDLVFPDEVCPCKCHDQFYSWYPSDDWFCPSGERKGGGKNEEPV